MCDRGITEGEPLFFAGLNPQRHQNLLRFLMSVFDSLGVLRYRMSPNKDSDLLSQFTIIKLVMSSGFGDLREANGTRWWCTSTFHTHTATDLFHHAVTSDKKLSTCVCVFRNHNLKLFYEHFAPPVDSAAFLYTHRPFIPRKNN